MEVNEGVGVVDRGRCETALVVSSSLVVFSLVCSMNVSLKGSSSREPESFCGSFCTILIKINNVNFPNAD